MRNSRHTLLGFIGIISLFILVIAFVYIVPRFLGQGTYPTNQQNNLASFTGTGYPSPLTEIPSVTPIISSASPKTIETQVYTEIPGLPFALTNTPISLITPAQNPEGSIYFIDTEDTILKKVEVDKAGTAKGDPIQISNQSLSSQDGISGLARVYPSPDGKRLFILRQSEGWDYGVYDILKGSFEYTDIPFEVSAFFGWYPDSKHILSRDNRGLWLVDLKDKNHVLLAPTELQEMNSIVGAAASPDGKQVIYCFLPPSADKSEIWIVNDQGENAQKLFEIPGYILDFAWSPDGKKVAFWNSGYWVMKPDGTDLHQFNKLTIRDHYYPALWSPDSRFLLTDHIGNTSNRSSEFEGDGSNIHVIDIERGETRTLLPDNSTGHLYPTWSPDGSKIAFVSIRGGKPDLWVVNRDGTHLQQITYQGRYIRYSFWMKQ